MRPHTLERSLVIAADPEAVWALLGGFAGLADWHPHLPPAAVEDGADPEVPGAVRVFAVDGAVVARELLLAHEPAARRYRYTLLEPLVLPVAEYVATRGPV
ncbi:SRPBCC family protein [Streptomyces sp. NPDC047974]|uniref:SRPBCC family protein n=1 Tax=Streptomyces sp. NPDC047974 TaxID=3154343 RepID=UPI0033F0197E